MQTLPTPPDAVLPGDDPFSPFSPTEQRTLRRALRLLHRHFHANRVRLDNSVLVGHFLRLLLGPRPREEFVALWLDAKRRYLGAETLCTGSLSECKIHSREIIRSALRWNASAVIFAHNHPSGDPTPSPDDEKLHWRLELAMRQVEVEILDNFVATATEIVSIKYPLVPAVRRRVG